MKQRYRERTLFLSTQSYSESAIFGAKTYRTVLAEKCHRKQTILVIDSPNVLVQVFLKTEPAKRNIN